MQAKLQNQTGFTLIEVIIALMTLVIATTAVIITINESIRNQIYLQDKTAATLVAVNVINEKRLGLLDTNPQGSMNMFDKEWLWNTQINPTDDSYVLKLEVGVHEKNTNNDIVTLSGYIFNAKK